MPLEKIIENAADSTFAGQSWISRMSLYTSFKSDIARLNLDDTQYEEAIRKLADALGV